MYIEFFKSRTGQKKTLQEAFAGHTAPISTMLEGLYCIMPNTQLKSKVFTLPKNCFYNP